MSKEINLMRLNYTRLIFEFNLCKDRLDYEKNENSNNKTGIAIFVILLISSFCADRYYLKTNSYIHSDFYLIWFEKINSLIFYISLVMSFGYAYKIISFRRNIMNIIKIYNNKFMSGFLNIEKILSKIQCNLKIEHYEDDNGIAFFAQKSLDEINLFLSSQEEYCTTDPITKVSTRLAFLGRGEREFERCRRYKSPLSIIHFDINFFKKINGLHGHAIDDSALFQVGQACLHKFRRTDTVGRLGAEEFAVLLPETNLVGAEIAAEQLRVILTDMAIKPFENVDITLSFSSSFMVAEYQEGDDNFEDILARADKGSR